MWVSKAAESSTETSQSCSCSAEKLKAAVASKPLDIGQATWIKHGSSSTGSSEETIDVRELEVTDMTLMRHRQLVEARRSLLSTLRQSHRQLDVQSLNRSLISIMRNSYQQRNSCPYDATSRWVDFTVRIKQENPAKVLRDYEAVQRLRREARGVKPSSGSSGDANTMDVWTRQFRMRADTSRLIHEALRPLLDRLGYTHRPYSVTVNGFAHTPEEVTQGSSGNGKRHQVEEVGLLYTIGSLAERGASEIFVNFDFDLR